MKKVLKNISNPYSTGGGGVFFENKVQTSFVVLMLADGFLPCLPGKIIDKLKLQCKYHEFNTDDIVAFTNDIKNKEEHKLLTQIKHDISITNSDKQFQEVITAAWADFNNPSFNKEKDKIALITGPLSKSDFYDTRIILDWARYSEDEKDYFVNKIKLSNFCSKAKQNKVEVFRNTIKIANGNKSVPDALIFSFLRHFHIIGYDLDIKDGVVHALLTSIINQYQPDQATSVWARISEEVSSYNQNAGTITKESLPKEITNFFKKEKIISMPENLLKKKKSIILKVKKQYKHNLFYASILGGWDENSQGDNNIIRLITQVDPKKWIEDIREINNNSEIFSFNNGRWQVKEKIPNLSKYALLFRDPCLDLIKNVSLKILSEIHSSFNSNSEGDIPSQYSSELRKGISETLVFLSIHSNELKNCTLKAEDIVCLTIIELFNNSDWKLWASLNDVLPILAEADPDKFLLSVQNALKRSPCPFARFFNEESSGIKFAHYINTLCHALEILAWNEKYLPRSIISLAKLASRDSDKILAYQFTNSIITILLPWFPQTTASIKTKIDVMKRIINFSPDISFKILLKLLPIRYQVSMGRHKPVFRKYFLDGWKEKVGINDYWEQVNEYATMAVDIARNNIHYVLQMVDNLDNIFMIKSYDVFLEYLSSDEIIRLPDGQKIKIWEKLFLLAKKHRCFPDAVWIMPDEKITLLEKTAEKLSPSDPKYLYGHLFSYKNTVFYKQDENWQTYEKRIQEKRLESLKEIYKDNKTNSILEFTEVVDEPMIVGSEFAIIAKGEDDHKLLPLLLNCQEEYKKQFIKGYVSFRYQEKRIEWIETLNTSNWTNEQKCNFLLFLPFNHEIWKKADEFLGKHIDCYWKNINIIPINTTGNLLPAINNFLKYGRYLLALSCIYSHFKSQNEFLKEQAIKSLIGGISSDESIIKKMNPYQLIEMIKMLQNDSNIDENKLYRIEWAYLSLFYSNYNADYNVEPKFLEKKLSQKPDFFVKIIQLLYCSQNDDKSKKKINRQMKNQVENAYKLLYHWRHPPGKMNDGSFSDKVLKEWFSEVKKHIAESDSFEVAMIHLGHVLFYAGPDSNGLWIQQSVAEILEDNDDIRQGFKLEVYNSRGTYIVDPSRNGEKELADSWRKKAEEIEKLGLTRFASFLKDLAHSYDPEEERVIPIHSKKLENDEDGVNNDD